MNMAPENAGHPVEAVTVTVTEKENQPKADSMNIITEKENQSIREKAIIQEKFLTRVLTILTFIFSLPVLGSVIWLLYMRGYDCEILLRLPKLQMGIGISLLFVFLVSNSVAFLESRFPMPGLVLVMAPLIVMLTMGLALTGAYKMESRTIPGSPMWLKLKVHNHNNWNNIRSCIFYSGACSDLVSRSFMLKSYDFSIKRLSPIEGGCCKPPSICEMQYVNATFWEKGDGVKDKLYSYDGDCDSWSNDQNTLCYNCNSCQEGFLRTVQGKWRKLGFFLVVMALVLIISHFLLFLATIWEHFARI